MNGQDAIRHAMRAGGWSQNRLAMAMGMLPQSLSNKMRQSDVKAGFLAEALDMAGFELAAVPKGSRMPAGAVVIDGRPVAASTPAWEVS